MAGEGKVLALPRVDRRQQGRALYEAAERLAVAMHEAQVLGDELLLRFEQIDAARRELEPLGLLTAVEFAPEVQAALEKWRTGDTFEVPEFLRAVSGQ